MLSTNLAFWLEIAKLVFFVGYIVSTIGVIIGVYSERDQFPKEKQDRGWLVLIISLGFDTFFTVLVFGTDGWISAIQRTEITALEKRLEPRDLNSAQVQRIADQLKQYADTPFDFLVEADAEPVTLMSEIGTALTSAGWKWQVAVGSILFTIPGKPGATISVSVGLQIQIDESTSEQWLPATIALRDALISEGIAATATRVPNMSAGDKAIHINIGRKP